jgi:hypothetical protein
MIVFHCPKCFQQYSVKDEFAGRRTTCRICRAGMAVPLFAVPAAPPGIHPGPANPADDLVRNLVISLLVVVMVPVATLLVLEILKRRESGQTTASVPYYSSGPRNTTASAPYYSTRPTPPTIAWKGTVEALCQMDSLPLVGQWVEVEGNVEHCTTAGSFSSVMLRGSGGFLAGYVSCGFDANVNPSGFVRVRGLVFSGSRNGIAVSLENCQLVR